MSFTETPWPANRSRFVQTASDNRAPRYPDSPNPPLEFVIEFDDERDKHLREQIRQGANTHTA